MWRADTENMPKSYYREKIITRGGKEVKVKELVVIECFAWSTGMKSYTITKWLPDSERWNCFCKGQTPEKWHPFPDNPTIGEHHDYSIQKPQEALLDDFV